MAFQPARPPPARAPLTHHEILAVVGPFSQRGRQVDLAGSDRMARRIQFKPVQHDSVLTGMARIDEVLQLENPGDGRWRLTREATLAPGLTARLIAEGAEPAALLAQIEAVPLARQLAAGPGWQLAKTHKLRSDGHEPLLVQAAAQLEALHLQMRVSPVKGIPAEIELKATGETLALPDDLLAVLGWHWARLITVSSGWGTRLRLRGAGSERSRDAEAKLELAVGHLARTLAEPPPQFHDRLVAARWRVAVRRAMPLIGSVLLVVAAWLLAKLDLAQDSVFRMLIFHAPPILLVFFFCLNELPRVEIPPLPRRPQGDSWRVPGPVGGH
jgi:hypothetical protein